MFNNDKTFSDFFTLTKKGWYPILFWPRNHTRVSWLILFHLYYQGAFLIPFLISSVVVGIPYALLEVSLGQWMKEGGIGAWDLTPVFKGNHFIWVFTISATRRDFIARFSLWQGIGFANLIIVFLGNVYYEVILAWTLRYLWDSFTFELPWKSCTNAWNTQCCEMKLLYGANYEAPSNLLASSNLTKNQPLLISRNATPIANCSRRVDPITEYWE